MTLALKDLRFAVRGLVRSPLFSIVAILSLALGIGANTAIFTLIDQILLRKLSVAAPEQLVMLFQQGAHNGSNMGQRMHGRRRLGGRVLRSRPDAVAADSRADPDEAGRRPRMGLGAHGRSSRALGAGVCAPEARLDGEVGRSAAADAVHADQAAGDDAARREGLVRVRARAVHEGTTARRAGRRRIFESAQRFSTPLLVLMCMVGLVLHVIPLAAPMRIYAFATSDCVDRFKARPVEFVKRSANQLAESRLDQALL
jgi:hypothetical protein